MTQIQLILSFNLKKKWVILVKIKQVIMRLQL